jgi:peroxiredoxin
MVLSLAVALLVFVLLACWFGYQLLAQNGRILRRIEALEETVERLSITSPDPSLKKSRLKRDGLEPGTQAPDFRIPRVDGGELTLAEFRGRPVVLVFSDPNCEPCDAVAPRLQERHGGDVAIVMVSRGELDANRAKIAQHGLTFPVGLQRQWEISREYAMFATPIAYQIDETGRIAAPVAVGPKAILSLFTNLHR